MTRSSPFVIELSEADRAVLGARRAAYTAPFHHVLRAKIVLMAADGLENVVIAERLDVSVGVVSRWRKRFFEHGLAGLAEAPRSGRPRAFSPSDAGRGDGHSMPVAGPGATGPAGAAGTTGRRVAR